MRALILTPEIKARIRAQVEWANRLENRYRVFVDKEPPGDNPAYVMMLDVGFRVVYSRTVLPNGEELRHLSISVTGSKYPSAPAAFTIATLFGFTGGEIQEDATLKPGPWQIQVNEIERCIVIAERIQEGQTL